MELKVRMQLNKNTNIEAVFEAADLQDAIRMAGVFLDFDGKCGMCSGEDITLNTRVTDQGFKFTEYSCRSCGGRRNFGKHKDGESFFLKPWEEKYQPTKGA